MMKITTYLRAATALSACGVLFSGYMSAVRFFTNSCAFNEPCPMFLGQPACYFGFSMFLGLFGVSMGALLLGARSARPIAANLLISTAGSAFAGYFAVAELRNGLRQGFGHYGLGVSTCLYGATFFLVMLGLSALALRKRA